MTSEEARIAFIDAALWHGSLDRAEAILTEHPEIAAGDIHVAAILGDDDAVRQFLAADPGNATAKGGPRGWDALTHLCFSKYLRLDRGRSYACNSSDGWLCWQQGFDRLTAAVDALLGYSVEPEFCASSSEFTAVAVPQAWHWSASWFWLAGGRTHR